MAEVQSNPYRDLLRIDPYGAPNVATPDLEAQLSADVDEVPEIDEDPMVMVQIRANIRSHLVNQFRGYKYWTKLYKQVGNDSLAKQNEDEARKSLEMIATIDRDSAEA